MDIARPDIRRQKRRNQIIFATVSVVVLGALTFGISRLKPAAPKVERGTVWIDTVKRGPMLRKPTRGIQRHGFPNIPQCNPVSNRGRIVRMFHPGASSVEGRSHGGSAI